jgi:hypothetical protein
MPAERRLLVVMRRRRERALDRDDRLMRSEPTSRGLKWTE